MANSDSLNIAPELDVKDWLSTDENLSLASLRGKVVMVEAFQMLCPGCVSHSLPQAMKVAQTFSPDDVAVIGLHTVFEHHSAQGTRDALAAFLHEYKITFPVAIDHPSESGPVPRTMEKYQMQGTPSLILIDRKGYLRRHAFGRIEDMVLGAELMSLMKEPGALSSDQIKIDTEDGENCDEDGCRVQG